MRYHHFKGEERCELAILLKKGYSIRSVAAAMGRNPASVGREIARNSVKGRYDPRKARHKAWVRRKYSKYQGMKVRERPELEAYVAGKLRCGWSPERIAGRWQFETGEAIHHTGIYKYLYSSFGQPLCRHLKYRRHGRKKRKRTKPVRELIKNRVFIDERPETINRRERYGDFEGDTLGVPKHTRETVVAIIERKSRYLLARKISRLKYAMEGFKELLVSLPARSLTLDNGVENVRYEVLGVPTYFCHPYSSWEKGQIENAFGCIREYIPKRASLASYSDEAVAAIVDAINRTPRKCLGFRTPKEVFEGQFLTTECCT